MLLVLLSITFFGCSAHEATEDWSYAYQRHTNLVKAVAAGQSAILDVEDPGSCVIPGVVLWPYLKEAWIARVNPAAGSTGLRPGDRILGLNGRYIRRLGVLLLKLSRLQSGDPLELTVERNHALRRVTIRCGDSTAVFNATARLLRAAADGDWQQCLQLATELPAIARVNYSWSAELKYNCNEALRLREHREPTLADASLAHQWARLRIEEAKEIPHGMDRVRWSVTDMVYWLERHGFDHFAQDLSDHLDAYTPDLW